MASSTDPLQLALEQTGIDFKKSTAEVAAYIRERAVHLTMLGSADPDFPKALAAETKNVASFAADVAVDRGNGVDQKVFTAIVMGLGGLVVA